MIIPVGINGTIDGVKRFFNPFKPKVKVKIVIGEPFKLVGYEDLTGLDLGDEGVKNGWQEITVTQIMPKIAALIEDPKLRGPYDK